MPVKRVLVYALCGLRESSSKLLSESVELGYKWKRSQLFGEASTAEPFPHS